MIRVEGELLRGLQRTELGLLREVDRICRAHGIRYTIIAGTMLGAARHGGFIPWDDDADVAMLRGEYERFREACRTELDPARFCFQDHAVTPGYRWGYGKLRRTDSLFLREHQEHMPYPQGIFIDVFPLDPVPESRAGRALFAVRCRLVRRLMWARVGKVAEKSAARRFVMRLADRISEETVLRLYDRLVRRASRFRSDWVRILTFPTPNREYGYRREWYADSDETVFEGVRFPGVKDADAYLTFKFGNWRELPPQERRKTHPVSAIRLPEDAEEKE